MLMTLCVLGVILLLLNIPMFVLMVATATIVILAHTDTPVMLIATQMFGSIDKFALMAIPFFIFGAAVMGEGGLSQRLVDWVLSMVGWMRGGLAMTTIASCEVFGTVSGSSAATTAAIGSILYPPLVKNKYGESFSLGLVTCTGAIASVIPPSIGMIVYSAITGASTGAVFIGGILPGILLGLLFGCWVLVHVYRREHPPDRGVRGWRCAQADPVRGVGARDARVDPGRHLFGDLHPDRGLRGLGGLCGVRRPFHLPGDEPEEAVRGGHRIRR